jgi:hypothetical protein
MTAPDWRHQAACKNTDPEMWHDHRAPQPATICATCPVIAQCRADTLDAPEPPVSSSWRAGRYIGYLHTTGWTNTMRDLEIDAGRTPRPRHKTTFQAFAAAKAARTHCNKGHPFNPEIDARTADGYRACRQCIRDNQARYKQKKKLNAA